MRINERQCWLPRREVSWTWMPWSNRAEGCRLEPCRVALDVFDPAGERGYRGSRTPFLARPREQGRIASGAPASLHQRPPYWSPILVAKILLIWFQRWVSRGLFPRDMGMGVVGGDDPWTLPPVLATCWARTAEGCVEGASPRTEV